MLPCFIQMASFMPILFKNSLILPIGASGPNTCSIVLRPSVARRISAICGHSSKMCLMVRSTWQLEHFDGSPFGFSIRWQCVSLVCPILNLVSMTSVSRSFAICFHGVTSFLMLLNLLVIGSIFQVFCHLFRTDFLMDA